MLVRNQEINLRKFNELLYNGGIFSAIINVQPLHQVIRFQGLILWFLTMFLFEQKALGPILSSQKRHSSLWMPKLLEKGR